MTTLKRLGYFAAILSLVLGASEVHAQSYGNSVNAGTGVSAGVGNTLNATVNAGASASTSGNGTGTIRRSATSAAAGSSSAASRASATGRANANINSRLNATTSSSTMGTTSTSTSSTTENMIVITRSDLATSTVVVVDPANVVTADDFSAYVKSVMQSDANLTKVASGDTKVAVTYGEPAKFLGIVPITVSTTATVASDGSVTISHPWWYGIFVKDDSAATFQGDLESTAGTIARASGGATFSSSDKARLVNAVRSVMKARYDATVSTSTSETTSY